MDLFDAARQDASGVPAPRADAPLAVRMRPRTLDEVVGQSHLLSDGSPLRRLIDDGGSGATSVILWGPPGTGKTTLAYLVAGNRRFVELSAVTAGVKDVRAVIEDSKRRVSTGERETVMFIDEVHRFTKSQQDSLLPAVENRWITLVAATTENPSFSVIGPLLSRSLLLTLQGLEPDDIAALVERACADERGLAGRVTVEPDAMAHIVRVAGADARKALTLLESVADAAGRGGVVTAALTEQAMDAALVAYDKSGDQHYDVISAFIKSMRGSDVDAALHYLARMVVAGEDPRFIARRMVVLAAEDIGMADPQALVVAQAAADAVSFIGMPEGRIILGEAVTYLASAPKSNRSYLAIDKAIADVKAGRAGTVPMHLRDGHYAGAKQLGHGVGYTYAHDAPHGVAHQQYLPDTLADARYYEPTNNGYERELTTRMQRLREMLGRDGLRDSRE